MLNTNQYHFPVVIGQQVFLRPYGNASLHWTGEPIPAVVQRITNRRYHVRTPDGKEIPVLKASCIGYDTETNSTFLAFESIDAFNKHRRYKDALFAIREVFSSVTAETLDYEDVMHIYKILEFANVVPKLTRISDNA